MHTNLWLHTTKQANKHQVRHTVFASVITSWTGIEFVCLFVYTFTCIHNRPQCRQNTMLFSRRITCKTRARLWSMADRNSVLDQSKEKINLLLDFLADIHSFIPDRNVYCKIPTIRVLFAKHTAKFYCSLFYEILTLSFLNSLSSLVRLLTRISFFFFLLVLFDELYFMSFHFVL